MPSSDGQDPLPSSVLDPGASTHCLHAVCVHTAHMQFVSECMSRAMKMKLQLKLRYVLRSLLYNVLTLCSLLMLVFWCSSMQLPLLSTTTRPHTVRYGRSTQSSHEVRPMILQAGKLGDSSRADASGCNLKRTSAGTHANTPLSFACNAFST